MMFDLRKKAIGAAVLMALAAPFAQNAIVPQSVLAAPATQTKAEDAFTVDLTKGENSLFEASNGWTNGIHVFQL